MKDTIKLLVNDYEIGEEDIQNPTGQSDINIVPVITGAGGNVGKILLGAALIAGAFAFGGLMFCWRFWKVSRSS